MTRLFAVCAPHFFSHTIRQCSRQLGRKKSHKSSGSPSHNDLLCCDASTHAYVRDGTWRTTDQKRIQFTRAQATTSSRIVMIIIRVFVSNKYIHACPAQSPMVHYNKQSRNLSSSKRMKYLMHRQDRKFLNAISPHNLNKKWMYVDVAHSLCNGASSPQGIAV